MESNCSLPGDLVQDILSRLSVRDLVRFRCVSKEWCTLIDNPSFINKHYQVQYSICNEDDNMHHFVYDAGWSEPDKFYLLSIQEGDAITLDLTDDLERDSKHGSNNDFDHSRLRWASGCPNGIICLECFYKNRELLGLWNPATRAFRTVEFPNVTCCGARASLAFNGLGFDPISNDFKILCSHGIDSGYLKAKVCYEIYSLRTNSWKCLRNTPDECVPPSFTDAYFNGVFYWALGPDEETCPNLMILSFNFSSEVFKLSDPPHDAVSPATRSKPYGIYLYQRMMALYKESVALFIIHEVQEGAALYNVDIWTVTRFDDFGVPLSWQHLLNVGPTPAKLSLTVPTTRINGDLLLDYRFPTEEGSTCPSDGDAECYLYNPATGEFKKFEITYSAIYRYVESLFPLPRGLLHT